MEFVHRPSWLSLESFNQLLDRYAPLPACQHCGSAEDLTVDHIVPRWAGGTDAASNLQILCRPCNSSKGIREDAYWKQPFYWDFPPDDAGFGNLRQAHRDLFNEVVDFRADYFGRNISDIARHLYVNAWVVGAGKTLGIPVAAWALNRAIRAKWGSAARRVDRLLVVAKDQAIRDQIAHAIPHDLVKFKVTPSAPRVGVIRDGVQFRQQAWLDSFDVIVTCEQQLWESNGSARPDLAKILAHFPMIAFDEPHYATSQIAKIVDSADSSICFGFTGTPVDGCGELLPRMILLTVYDYQEASATDRGLKYLDDTPDHLPWFFRELKLDEGMTLEHGLPSTTKDPRRQGYSKQIECQKAVVNACLEEAVTLERMGAGGESAAPHRRQPDVEVSLHYPAHILVFFDNIATAEELADHFNRYLDTVRDEFPADRGWRIEVVHAGGKGRGGRQLAPKPLARRPGEKPHPWLYAYKSSGKLDTYCARVLFVVDMAREGVNNPYCCIVGVACSAQSLLDSVQGWLGRQLRAVTSWLSRRLRVPPARLDMVRIITHETFNVRPVVERGIAFICDMRGHLDGLPWIENLDSAEPVPLKEIERNISVPLKDKLEIVGLIEDSQAVGAPVDIEAIIREKAPAGGKRAERLRELAETYQQEPAAARRELRLDAELTPTFILTRERLRHTPTDVDLERHVRIHAPELIGRLPVDDYNRPFLFHMHQRHADRFQQPPLTSSSTINELCKTLVAAPVFGALGKRLEGPRNDVFQLATAAVKRKLDVPRDVQLKDGSDWDIPQAHAIIRRPDIQLELTGWVIGRLIDRGHCPSLRGLASPDADRDAA